MTIGLKLVTLTFQTKPGEAVTQNQKNNLLQGLQEHKTLQQILQIALG